jgi:hypothetical protein
MTSLCVCFDYQKKNEFEFLRLFKLLSKINQSAGRKTEQGEYSENPKWILAAQQSSTQQNHHEGAHD